MEKTLIGLFVIIASLSLIIGVANTSVLYLEDFIGPQGPQGEIGPVGSVGPRGLPGKDGENGKDGKDLEPNEAPEILSLSPKGNIGWNDDWILEANIQDPEDDLMKIEFYFCSNENPTHWILCLNSIGGCGTYSVNITDMKNNILTSCKNSFTWRIDVMDGENLISNTQSFTLAKDYCSVIQ